MERMFSGFTLGNLELLNRFVFPPIKLGIGNPDGTVTDRQLTFYRQIAQGGPGVVIIEPVSVTADNTTSRFSGYPRRRSNSSGRLADHGSGR